MYKIIIGLSILSVLISESLPYVAMLLALLASILVTRENKIHE